MRFESQGDRNIPKVTDLVVESSEDAATLMVKLRATSQFQTFPLDE